MAPPLRFTPREDRLILAMVKTGYTMREIAERIGKTKSQVIGRYHRLRSTVFPCDEARRDREIQERAERQVEQRRIANTTAIILREVRRGRGPHHRVAIKRARQNGATFALIGNILGLSPERVRQIHNGG